MAAPYPLWWQRPATAALLALLLAPSACVDTRHHYPSLAPRPAEQRDDVEPVRPHPPLIADPALDRQIVEDERTLAAITARFDPLGTRAEAAVAAAQGAKPGSDAWLQAHAALSALDAPRTELADLAARLDTESVERGKRGLAAYPALEGLRARVEAEFAHVSTKIDDLGNQLK